MTRIVHIVAAARPNFMKVAPLWHALKAAPDFTPVLIHSGQHYDVNMSDAFFRDLRLPAPDHHLGIGSGSHAEQTGGVMVAYEKIALAERPDWLVVVGDVNTTAACAMVAAKLCVPLVHLEAGLRSRDKAMPEEVNRLVTDVLADVLWTPSPDADSNLISEGVDPERISHVGNIMIDSFELVRPAIEAAGTARRLGLEPGGYLRRHAPPPVQRRRSLRTLAARGGARARAAAPAARFPGPSAHRGAPRRDRARRTTRGRRSPAGRTALLCRVHEPRDRRGGRNHRFGRGPGRNHLSRHSVPDPAP
jgi:UDP-N-acetylglucosamine 2-epimerase (non-hydrolysing)